MGGATEGKGLRELTGTEIRDHGAVGAEGPRTPSKKRSPSQPAPTENTPARSIPVYAFVVC